MGRWVRRLGGLVLLLLAAGLFVGLTADGLVVVTARHTIAHELRQRLPGWLVAPDPEPSRRGGLRGLVTDAAGRPLAGASVLVADRRGGAYRATSGADGRYAIDGVPSGAYRPVVAAAGHGPVTDLFALPTPWPVIGTLRWRPPVAVAASAITTADLQLAAPRRLAATPDAQLRFEGETLIERGDPFPGRARRQAFSVVTERRVTSGVIYAPAEGGPYPTIMIIYPGLPETWENVSVPLAAGGFTVIAYTPLNFPDLDADTAELLFLTDALNAGRLTAHAAPGRACAAGGSFSTIWTFLLLQETDAYRCALALGGIGDAFLYYEDWTAGRIVPNAHFAPVPQMMAAMGEPDLAPDLFLRLSAIEHARRLPPLLIVHGSGDTIVRTNQSEQLAARLQARGQPAELRLYNGMEHYLAANTADADTVDLLTRTLAFFRRHLG